jgi:hypothetical protein
MLNSDSDADIQTKYGSSRNRLLHMVVISYIHSLPDTVNMANETSESPPRRSDHPIFALASSQFTFSAAGPSDGSTPSFHPPSPFHQNTPQEKGGREKQDSRRITLSLRSLLPSKDLLPPLLIFLSLLPSL